MFSHKTTNAQKKYSEDATVTGTNCGERTESGKNMVDFECDRKHSLFSHWYKKVQKNPGT